MKTKSIFRSLTFWSVFAAAINALAPIAMRTIEQNRLPSEAEFAQALFAVTTAIAGVYGRYRASSQIDAPAWMPSFPAQAEKQKSDEASQ